MIKRKWPKIDRGGPRAPSEAKGGAGGLRLGPPLVSWPVPSLRSPPGKAVGSSAKRQPSSGGCKGRGPSAEGPPLRGRSALTGGPVPPCAPLPSGGISISAARRAEEIASLRGPPRPSPPAVRGGIWADVSPLGRMQEISPPRGPKGSLEPSTKLVAGQAAGPLGKPGASQNCPLPYQGESGGLEPSTKPVAGQAAAPLHSLSP